MATVTITRRAVARYSVEVDTMMGDGSMEADHFMALQGTLLVPIVRPGLVRVGRTLKVQLGPKSFARVRGLAVGDVVSITT